MILIDGKKAAAELREELKHEVIGLKAKYNKVPGLTVILIGDILQAKTENVKVYLQAIHYH